MNEHEHDRDGLVSDEIPWSENSWISTEGFITDGGMGDIKPPSF